jgi:hypothetical protein
VTAAPPSGAGPSVAPRVAIVADDLIWATRLADGVRASGADAVPVRSAAAVDAALGDADGAIVDLTSRAYDAMAVLGAAAAAGVPAIAVGQHDDAPARRAARAAGAARVYAYRALFEHGTRELGAWLATLPARAPSEAAR